jgi:putative DNA primase/helicase
MSQRKGTSRLTLVQPPTTDALMPRAVEWLWAGRIARGKLTVIVGPADTKKSLLAAWIAATITTGGEWPDDGGGCAEAGNVLFLQGEDDFHDTTLPRLIAAGTEVGTKPVLTGGPFLTIVPQVARLSLRETLAQLDRDGFWNTKSLRLLLIDPFNAFAEGQQSHLMGTALQNLVDLAAQQRIAIVLVHHFGKKLSRTVDAMVFGSSMIRTKARLMLAVQTDPDDPGRSIITGHKANIAARKAEGLIYSTTMRDVEIADGNLVPFPTIEWGGTDERTSDEVATENFEKQREAAKAAKARRQGKRGSAREFLEDLLSPDVTLETRIIEEKAREAGILGSTSRLDNSTVLKAAADEIGIRREYGKWTCGLTACLQRCGDGWPNLVTTFALPA